MFKPFFNLSLLLNPITCKRSQKKHKIMLTNNLGTWYLRKLGSKSFQISSPIQKSMVQDACHCSPKSYHMQPVEKKKVMFSIHHILALIMKEKELGKGIHVREWLNREIPPKHMGSCLSCKYESWSCQCVPRVSGRPCTIYHCWLHSSQYNPQESVNWRQWWTQLERKIHLSTKELGFESFLSILNPNSHPLSNPPQHTCFMKISFHLWSQATSRNPA